VTGGDSLGTTAGNLWAQVKDQGNAYHAEAEARRADRNQHGGCETRKDNK